MTKILMVCLGNICRSPLAEGILASKLPKNLFIVDSAGTASYHIGQSPDPRSIDIANKNGIDISKQEARQFKTKDFIDFDIIYAMDSSNYKNIIALAKNNNDIAKVKLILKEDHNLLQINVPDPYYDTKKGFEKVFNLLEKTCVLIAQKLYEY